ncbi:MAG: M23 family metallopeptidase [Thermodesulfobacteriota bacterium]
MAAARTNATPSSHSPARKLLSLYSLQALFFLFCIILTVTLKLTVFEQSVETAAMTTVEETADFSQLTDTDFQDDLIDDPPSLFQEESTSSRTLYKTIEGQLQRGDSLESALAREALPSEIRRAVIDSLATCLDFRKLRPNDKFTIELADDESLKRCTFESGPLEVYQVDRNDEGDLEASRIPVDVEYRLQLIEGTVSSSLFEAFTSTGEDPRVVYAFADIFGSKVDFNTESQMGDRFAAIVPKYYKGESFLGYGKILYARYEQAGRTLQTYYYAEENGYFDENGQDFGTAFLRSPVPIGRVTSNFTMRRKHPILGTVRPHLGIDLAAPTGTPIMAASDGTVIFAGRKGGFGKQVVVQHRNGVKTYYGHLSRFNKGIRSGARVAQKDIIGFVGSTGMSTGPHLDYRLEQSGKFVNPFSVRFSPRVTLAGSKLSKFKQLKQTYAAYLATAAGNNIITVKTVTVSDEMPIRFL